jgi:hypothetical protein
MRTRIRRTTSARERQRLEQAISKLEYRRHLDFAKH